MPNIDSSNVSNAIVKTVSIEFAKHLLGNLQMANLVNRNFEPLIADRGDTVNVPIPASLTANKINMNTGAVTRQQVSAGNAQIVLNTHAESSFAITDIARALSSPDLMKMYIISALNSLAETIETDLLGTYAGFTSNTAIGTGGTLLTESVVDKAESNLFKAKVPANLPLYLAVDADNYSALRQIPRFSENQTAGTGGQTILNGGVGKIKNFNVFRSQYITSTGGTTQHCLAFATDALGLIMRRLPAPLPGTGVFSEYAEVGGYGFRILMSYDKDTLAPTFTADCLYGIAVYRNQFGQHITA